MRKKLDTRFPASRIKKIMQADEDVGKIALAVPLLVSKALELFLQDLCDRTYEITVQRGAKTMNSLHLKQCVQSFNVFDFLRDIVSKVPDYGSTDASGEDRAAKRRKAVDEAENDSDEELRKSRNEGAGQSSAVRGRGRGRGRGRWVRGSRSAEREISASDKYEDDPDISVPPDDKLHTQNLERPDDDPSSREPKETPISTSISSAVVRNFDLNMDLDENGDTAAGTATATGSTATTSSSATKIEELPVWPPADMGNMHIDPLQVSMFNKSLDEEEEDYDNEDG